MGAIRGFIALLAFCIVSNASALENYSPGDVSRLTQSAVSSLIKTVAVGADHRAYQSAAPGGITGFDLGLEVTAIDISPEFIDAMKLAGVSVTIPPTIALPRFNVHKGLPWDLDLGFSYFGYDDNQLLGGELQWALMEGSSSAPSIAIRGSESLVRLFFMHTRTFTLDLVMSKTLGFFFEPYAGIGGRWLKGSLDVSQSGVAGLPVSVSGEYSTSTWHAYFGLPIKFSTIHMTLQYDYSGVEISTYGAKISLSI